MRRITIALSAAVLLLALGPASALARHHHRRHHSHVRHARIERFGRDVASAPTNSGSTSADNAGTVQSFSGDQLTIMLADGSTVSGTVNGDTELECTSSESSQTMHAEGAGGSGDQSGDDNQAEGSDDQTGGEDQGDAAEQNDNQAEDQNDDQAEEQNDDQNDEAENNCSTANLTPGTVVHEAELRISSTGAAWKKVELGS